MEDNYDDMMEYVQRVIDTLVEMGWVELSGVNDDGEFIYMHTAKMDKDIDDLIKDYNKYIDLRMKPEQMN